MSNRERHLAVALGALLVVILAAVAYRGVRSAIDARRQRELALQTEIAKKRRTVQAGQPIADRMQVYEQRSLPSDQQAAGTLYQTWLLQSVTEVDLDDANVNAVTSRGKEGAYHEFAFTVSGRGDLRQLVRFLHKFYSADYLHRIKRLNLRRIPDSRRLDVSLSIEALSLPTADRESELSQAKSRRLKQAELTNYLEQISARNFSGPANREPEFASVDPPKAYLQRPFKFALKAKDPDKYDGLSYSLETSPLKGATLNPKSGELEWTPDNLGSYEFVVKITDDGLPPKSVTKTFRIEVEEAPIGDVAKPTNFEPGQNAYLTAITQVENRRQAWINLRRDNKLLKLLEGSEFEVGDVKLTMRQIHDKTVEVESKTLSERWQVGLGQNLEKSRTLAAEARAESAAAKAKLEEAKPEAEGSKSPTNGAPPEADDAESEEGGAKPEMVETMPEVGGPLPGSIEAPGESGQAGVEPGPEKPEHGPP